METNTRRRRKEENVKKERRIAEKEGDEDEKLMELSKKLGKLIPVDRLGVSYCTL